jgi:hypothetical protein
VKYLSLAQINESVENLAPVHPFFLITFLVAKKMELPIGSKISIQLDNATEQFLRAFYKLHPKSDWFFQPYKGANREKTWVKPNYASTGLQSINTQTFRDAFDHSSGTAFWGWSPNYLSVLQSRLGRKRIPLFHLASWIFRNTTFPDSSTRQDVLLKFRADFKLTDSEVSALFDTSIASALDERNAFQEVPAAWNDIISRFPMPPDVGPEAEALLAFIGMQSLGPIAHLEFNPAPRLNLITGDNGVGKTFLLDTIWWVLTNEWVDYPVAPRNTTFFSATPSITYQLAGMIAHRPQTALFDGKRGWITPTNRDVSRSLVLYSRSDGAFAVWDPIRYQNAQFPEKLHFERDSVWGGKDRLIEGLLRDLVTWGTESDGQVMELFSRTLARLSPPEMQILSLGEPVRIPGYSQQIPTLRHPYGEIPLIFESAGIKRMVAMAYLVIWAWTEHKTLAAALEQRTASKLVLLVDELEAHLHPKWQRTVLPALLGVLSDLSSELDSQIFVATHSPFVTASMENDFRHESDKFFTLDIQNNGLAMFHELEYRPRGAVDSWLISPAFGLKDARSVEAAAAIRRATALQDEAEPDQKAVRHAHEELTKLLPTGDRFWPRWLLFAKKHGVQI